jgi:hypothetical protein
MEHITSTCGTALPCGSRASFEDYGALTLRCATQINYLVVRAAGTSGPAANQFAEHAFGVLMGWQALVNEDPCAGEVDRDRRMLERLLGW